MVPRHQVAVVVDSSACLPPQLADRWQISVVPHELITGSSTFRDGIDITPKQFYRLLRNGDSPITTSAPGPAAFLEAFKAAAVDAESVLCITVASNVSATFESARIACAQAQEALPQRQFQVMDSRAAAGAAGLIALAASRAAAQSHNLDEVMKYAEQLIPQVQLIAFLDTLRYLERSGRVGRVQAWAGSVLGIKPVVELKLGQARLVERPRSRERAMDRLVGIMKARTEERPLRVAVMEADASREAEELRQRVEEEFDCRELFVSQFTPVMGAHTGPGLLGLAFHAEP